MSFRVPVLNYCHFEPLALPFELYPMCWPGVSIYNDGKSSIRIIHGMNESSPRCPDCGAGAACLGAIPATDIFAGKRLAAPIDGGALYRCH